MAETGFKPTVRRSLTRHNLIKISIHKPCTDNCGGLKIEPVTIENINLVLPIFLNIFYFFFKAYFLLEVLFRLSVYVSEQTFQIFVRNRCRLYSVFLDTFSVVLITTIELVYICNPITFYRGRICAFSTCFSIVTGSIIKPLQLSVHGLWILFRSSQAQVHTTSPYNL